MYSFFVCLKGALICNVLNPSVTRDLYEHITQPDQSNILTNLLCTKGWLTVHNMNSVWMILPLFLMGMITTEKQYLGDGIKTI